MKLFLLTCIVGLSMSAQTLTIGGTSNAPVVSNHGNHNVLAYILRTEYDGFVSGLRYFDVANLARNPLDKAGLVIGGSHAHAAGAMQMHRPDGSPVGPPNKISVDVVLTSDGKFHGPDTLKESAGQLASFINPIDRTVQGLYSQYAAVLPGPPSVPYLAPPTIDRGGPCGASPGGARDVLTQQPLN